MPSFFLERSLWAQGYRFIAGVDEAGRGPLAGPVVAAAVIIERGREVGQVDDSKKLPRHRRAGLYDQIHASALAVGVGVVDHATIDRINILQATLEAMRGALDALDIVPEYVLVDGNRFQHESLPFRTVVDGDALCSSIAAASIVAKETRDRLMERLDEEYPQYCFSRNKGYGTREHIEAIRRYGMSPVHRRSFHLHAVQESLAFPHPADRSSRTE